MENRIIEVKLSLLNDGNWMVATRKEFAPEYGGGEQTFTELCGPNVHRALDVAKGMCTMSPGRRTDLAAPVATLAGAVCNHPDCSRQDGLKRCGNCHRHFCDSHGSERCWVCGVA